MTAPEGPSVVRVGARKPTPGAAGFTSRLGGELLVVVVLCVVGRQVGWTLAVAFALLPGMRAWLVARLRLGFGLDPSLCLALVAGLWAGARAAGAVLAASVLVGVALETLARRRVSDGRRRTR